MRVLLTQLEKSHASLQRSIAVFERVSLGADTDLIDTTRAGGHSELRGHLRAKLEGAARLDDAAARKFDIACAQLINGLKTKLIDE